MEMSSAMGASAIVHLVDQVLVDFPVYVYNLWQPYCVHSRVAVHICIEGLRKCRLHQSGLNGGVKCYVSMRNRTPRVQGSVWTSKL